MTLTVYILKGQDRNPAVRLLECLTRCGLLTERITWNESMDMVVLTIKEATQKDIDAFSAKMQYRVATE